jgi:hypothetical protein
MQPVLRTVHGQPSWRFASDTVEAYLTRLGGHLGPVTFDRRGRRFQPYAVAPWAEEATDPRLPPILKVLRGDFFCLPFGGNTKAFGRERHPIHGETANAKWRFDGFVSTRGTHTVALSLRTRLRRGTVEKRITLVDGHNAVYCRHRILGMNGPMCFGHHAMLRFPDRPGSGLVSTSRFVYGQVFPEPAEQPEQRGYSLLKPGAEFVRLECVPTITGETTDLSRYPARRGFEDIAMVLSDPEVPLAWTAVAFPKERFVWFALKDPRVLRGTIFWLSNGGRHYSPWNGRHLNVMGLEEVTSFFHPGLAESVRPNTLRARGFPTCVELSPTNPFIVSYIMAVAQVPAGFDHVAAIEPGATGQTVRIVSANGKSVTTPLDAGFLQRGG